MDLIFNCGSVRETEASLSDIHGISVEMLCDFLDRYELRHSNAGEPRTVLYRAFKKATNAKLKPDVKTLWHHFCRRPRGQPVAELLPLGQVISTIWRDLYEIASSQMSRADWDVFRKELEEDCDCHSAFLYQHKLDPKTEDEGPHGLLINTLEIPGAAKIHFVSEGPEIVIDILRCLNDRRGIALEEAYHRATEPCIVRFLVADCRKFDV